MNCWKELVNASSWVELVHVSLLGLALWPSGNVACVGLTPQVA